MPLLSHGGDPGVNGLLLSLHQLDIRQDLVDLLSGHLHVFLTDRRHLQQPARSGEKQTGVCVCECVCVWCCSTYSGDLALDVLQQVLLPPQEERVLELCVVPLWLYQTPLLDVDHLSEAICSNKYTPAQPRRRPSENEDEEEMGPEEPLTHVELSDETGHVVVLEELW